MEEKGRLSGDNTPRAAGVAGRIDDHPKEAVMLWARQGLPPPPPAPSENFKPVACGARTI